MLLIHDAGEPGVMLLVDDDVEPGAMLLFHDDDSESGVMLLIHDDAGTGEVSQFLVFSPNGSPCGRLSQKPGQTDSNSNPDQKDQFLNLFWAPLGPYRGPTVRAWAPGATC